MGTFFTVILVIVLLYTFGMLIFGMGGFVFYSISKKEDSKSSGCLKLILSIIIALIILFCIGYCADDSPWEPRHTQIDKGELKEVNTFILPSSIA